MHIFLAGATGVIGRQLVPMLVNEGHVVTGATRSETRRDLIRQMGGRPVVLDALDRDGVMKALDAARPDVVINQMTDLAGRDFAANARLRIEGSRNLVDAALATGVRRMIAESIAWMYAPGEGPASEREPLDLDGPPAHARPAGAVHTLESAVVEMPIGVALRYGILYGRGTWYARDGLTTAQIRAGEIAANDAVTSFLDVADAARAALLALEWPAGAYNVVDDEPAPASAWVPAYAILVGAAVPPVTHGGEAWERGASNAKAKALGWRPLTPTWREGFKTALAA